jgi:hypothetical protein
MVVGGGSVSPAVGESLRGSLDPFPRQTLVGLASGPLTYFSPFYNSRDWKSIAWWFECYGCLPSGALANPVTMYIETSESMDAQFEVLAMQTAVEETRYSGEVSDPSSLVRARIVVSTGFILNVALRFVARGR